MIWQRSASTNSGCMDSGEAPENLIAIWSISCLGVTKVLFLLAYGILRRPADVSRLYNRHQSGGTIRLIRSRHPKQ